MARKINLDNTKNNIETWMRNNLSKTDYDSLIKSIPEKLSISSRTWEHYRNGRTIIGIDKIQELHNILLPYVREADKKNFTIINLIKQ